MSYPTLMEILASHFECIAHQGTAALGALRKTILKRFAIMLSVRFSTAC
jgi:hypothetical protein